MMRKSWFENLFGFRESVSSVEENFIVTHRDGHAFLTSKVNNRTWNAGAFSVRNISSFAVPSPSAHPGVLHVICGRPGDLTLVNVLTAQSFGFFDGSTFQAASNFNCLEFTSDMQTASDGVTNYVFDYTQGPYCALAAGPAIVYRNYFVPHSDGVVGQLIQEVELLKRSPIGQFVVHGYPILNANRLEQIKDANWDDLDQFSIGLHEHCEVTTTQVGHQVTITGVPEGRIVHHVYAAALNFMGTVILNPTSERIGRQMLKAEYRATVLAAAEMAKKYPGRKGSNKLVLTQVGTGVFGNPREWVIEAIDTSADLILESGLQVYVVCFSNYDFQESMSAGLEKLMKKLGGRIITEECELVD
jgi:hypothetical protein